MTPSHIVCFPFNVLSHTKDHQEMINGHNRPSIFQDIKHIKDQGFRERKPFHNVSHMTVWPCVIDPSSKNLGENSSPVLLGWDTLYMTLLPYSLLIFDPTKPGVRRLCHPWVFHTAPARRKTKLGSKTPLL